MVRAKEKNIYQPVTPNKQPRAPSLRRLKQEGGKAQANVAEEGERIGGMRRMLEILRL